MKSTKTLVTIVLSTIISMTVAAQTPLTYTDIVKADSLSATELYTRAKLWFATNYNNSKAVIQADDKEAGQIVGKATMRYEPTFFIASGPVKGTVDYTISVLLKDGRFKYEVTNFYHTADTEEYPFNMGLITTETECPTKPPKGLLVKKEWPNKAWVDIKNQIDTYTKKLVDNLRLEMAKPEKEW